MNHTAPDVATAASQNRRELLQAGAFVAMSCITAGLSNLASRRRLYADQAPLGDLEARVPLAFEGWQGQPLEARFVVDPALQESVVQAYDATLARLYADGKGHAVSLVLAYVREVTDGRRVHDPEVCYPAQGFTVADRHTTLVPLGQYQVPAVVFTSSGGNGSTRERVLYWIVEGPSIAASNLERKLNRIRLGFTGISADGLLVRLSVPQSSNGSEDLLLQEFLHSLARHVSTELRAKLLGAPHVSV